MRQPVKKLDQFLLKSFVGPFFAILGIVTFILVMQFLWLYIDELVGKGPLAQESSALWNGRLVTVRL